MPQPPLIASLRSRGADLLGRAQRVLVPPEPQAQQFSGAVKGLGLPEVPSALISTKAQEIAGSQDALYGSITANAGPRRDRMKIYPGTGLTPVQLTGILRQADMGLVDRWQELIGQAIKRDGRAYNADRGRRVAVVGRPYSIRPKLGHPEEAQVAVVMAAVVQECLDGMSGWKRALRHLLSAPGAGFAACEKIYRWRKIRVPWGKAGSLVTIEVKSLEELRRVHGKHFGFNTDQTSDMPIAGMGRMVQIEGQTPLLNQAVGSIYLPKTKFVFHTSGDDGRIEERGWWRQAIWLHMLKQKAISQWAEFVGRFGLPNVRGEVPYNIWADAKRASMYQRFLQHFGDSFATLFPNDLKVVVDQYQAGGTSKDAFASFIGWIDTAMSILIQAEHLTTEIGDAGSYNAAAEQAQEKRAVVEDDAEGLAETLRDQLFWSLIWLNVEDLSYQLNVEPWRLMRNLPVIAFRLDARTSRKERLEELDIAKNKLGLSITERQVRDEGGFEQPGPDEATLEGQHVVVPADSVTVSAKKAIAGHDNSKPAAPASAPKIELTSTDLATIVTVDQALASVGLPPRTDADGGLTVAEFQAKHAKTVSAAAAATEGDQPAA